MATAASWTAACSRTSRSASSTAATAAEPRWPTFGIKLSGRPDANQKLRAPIRGGPVGLLKGMVGTMTNFHDQMYLDQPSVVGPHRSSWTAASSGPRTSTSPTPTRRCCSTTGGPRPRSSWPRGTRRVQGQVPGPTGGRPGPLTPWPIRTTSGASPSRCPPPSRTTTASPSRCWHGQGEAEGLRLGVAPAHPPEEGPRAAARGARRPGRRADREGGVAGLGGRQVLHRSPLQRLSHGDGAPRRRRRRRAGGAAHRRLAVPGTTEGGAGLR